MKGQVIPTPVTPADSSATARDALQWRRLAKMNTIKSSQQSTNNALSTVLAILIVELNNNLLNMAGINCFDNTYKVQIHSTDY